MNTTTIIRNIMGNDVTITLTDEEIRKIARDMQLENDKAEVISRLENSDPEYDMDEIPDDLIEEIAKGFRERMNDAEEYKMADALRAFSSQLEEYEKKDKVFTVEVELTMRKQYTIRAKDEDDAERIFTAWSERNSRQMTEDLTEDAEYNGEWDTDGYYEDSSYYPEDADIGEEDI